MQRIDGHTHLSPEADLDIETNLSEHDVDEFVSDYVERIRSSPVDHAVAIINDDTFLNHPAAVDTIIDARDDTDAFSIVFMIDPRSDRAEEHLDRIVELDALGIKLHPYQQRLSDQAHFPEIAETMRRVEREELLTIIDCSYGGEYMYETNGVRLGHALAKVVNSPLILAHGGGTKIDEAFLTAETFDNVYLDTSFSLPYWSGSTVEDDFAFAMAEMDMERWVWGSDIPFAGLQESIDCVEHLLAKHDLTDNAEQLFAENMAALLE
jgi:predicted TIM-barrel fold metal-dependent hydrolase